MRRCAGLGLAQPRPPPQPHREVDVRERQQDFGNPGKKALNHKFVGHPNVVTIDVHSTRTTVPGTTVIP